MSTHSIIGIKTEEGFEGKYCHYDGYPTGVGYSILEAIDHFGLKKAINVLTKEHKSGWSSIAGCDWSLEPDFNSNDDPLKEEERHPRCACCGDLGEDWEGNKIVAKKWTVDQDYDVACDWAYVFDVPKGRVNYPKLIVYSNRWDKSEWTERMVIDLNGSRQSLRKKLLELEKENIYELSNN